MFYLIPFIRDNMVDFIVLSHTYDFLSLVIRDNRVDYIKFQDHMLVTRANMLMIIK